MQNGQERLLRNDLNKVHLESWIQPKRVIVKSSLLQTFTKIGPNTRGQNRLIWTKNMCKDNFLGCIWKQNRPNQDGHLNERYEWKISNWIFDLKGSTSRFRNGPHVYVRTSTRTFSPVFIWKQLIKHSYLQSFKILFCLQAAWTLIRLSNFQLIFTSDSEGWSENLIDRCKSSGLPFDFNGKKFLPRTKLPKKAKTPNKSSKIRRLHNVESTHKTNIKR